MITLNLIPPGLKKDYESSVLLRHWLNAVVVATIVIFIGTAGVVGLQVMMSRHAQKIQTDLKQLQQRQARSNGKDITSTTSQLNTTIKTLSTALGSPRSWANDSATILSGLPTSILISSLTLQQNGQFHLIGVADSRQAFVALDTALKANPQLSKVTTSSAASKRIAVPFDFTGVLLSTTKQ